MRRVFQRHPYARAVRNEFSPQALARSRHLKRARDIQPSAGISHLAELVGNADPVKRDLAGMGQAMACWDKVPGIGFRGRGVMPWARPAITAGRAAMTARRSRPRILPSSSGWPGSIGTAAVASTEPGICACISPDTGFASASGQCGTASRYDHWIRKGSCDAGGGDGEGTHAISRYRLGGNNPLYLLPASQHRQYKSPILLLRSVTNDYQNHVSSGGDCRSRLFRRSMLGTDAASAHQDDATSTGKEFTSKHPRMASHQLYIRQVQRAPNHS
jgi:hypothetical protein